MNNKRFEYKLHLRDTDAQYWSLKIFLGEKLLAVHTSKTLSYLQTVEESAK